MINFKMISIGLVALAILCFVGASISLKMGSYGDFNTEKLCNEKSEKLRSEDPKTCAVWDGAQCRKGKPEGIFCAAQANYVPLSLVIIGLLCIIVSIGLAVYSKFFNKSSKND